MTKFKLEIEYEEGDDKAEKIKINDEVIDPDDAQDKPYPPGNVLDIIMITDGSRCVWRRGKLYCGS